ncbi:hypothetical protein [Thiocapsa bogorovii]|uniref:hypothetical protein n=1 Tax=Thiocapsa bogorovii TaxID=521689 RepID=UPI001E4646FB|nr:hypothetical protein [Thiocapsa bogorovii]UHD17520.1 hypothetical protein LT988_05570 [Thiocapsa bogorovii]
MLQLEAITKDAQLAGLDPNDIVRVVSVEPVGTDALTVYFKGSDGNLAEQMLLPTNRARLVIVGVSCRFQCADWAAQRDAYVPEDLLQGLRQRKRPGGSSDGVYDCFR